MHIPTRYYMQYMYKCFRYYILIASYMHGLLVGKIQDGRRKNGGKERESKKKDKQGKVEKHKSKRQSFKHWGGKEKRKVGKNKQSMGGTHCHGWS